MMIDNPNFNNILREALDEQNARKAYDPVAEAYNIIYNELQKFEQDPANHIIGCDVLEEVLGYLGEALS